MGAGDATPGPHPCPRALSMFQGSSPKGSLCRPPCSADGEAGSASAAQCPASQSPPRAPRSTPRTPSGPASARRTPGTSRSTRPPCTRRRASVRRVHTSRTGRRRPGRRRNARIASNTSPFERPRATGTCRLLLLAGARVSLRLALFCGDRSGTPCRPSTHARGDPEHAEGRRASRPPVCHRSPARRPALRRHVAVPVFDPLWLAERRRGRAADRWCSPTRGGGKPSVTYRTQLIADS